MTAMALQDRPGTAAVREASVRAGLRAGTWCIGSRMLPPGPLNGRSRSDEGSTRTIGGTMTSSLHATQVRQSPARRRNGWDRAA